MIITLLRKHFVLSKLKAALQLTIFVQTIIHFCHTVEKYCWFNLKK